MQAASVENDEDVLGDKEDEAVIDETLPVSINPEINKLFKESLLNEEYPIQCGKEYPIQSGSNETIIVTVLMMKNVKNVPMGIGWIDNDTQFEYDENRNGVCCDFIYDA